MPSPKTTPKTKLKQSKTAPAKEEATREPERIDPFIVEKSKEAASPTQPKEKTTQPVKKVSPRTNPVPPQRSNEPAVKLEAIVETPRCRSLAILGTMVSSNFLQYSLIDRCSTSLIIVRYFRLHSQMLANPSLLPAFVASLPTKEFEWLRSRVKI